MTARATQKRGLFPALLVAFTLSPGCAHANESQLASSAGAVAPAGAVIATEPGGDRLTTPPTSQPVASAADQPVRPSPEQLRQAIDAIVGQPALARARFSAFVVPLRRGANLAADRVSQSQPTSQPASRPVAASQPVAEACSAAPLVELAADAARVPASNAKLLTTTAALRALGRRYHFVTEVGWRGSRIYLRGRGDPLLRRSDLLRLARAVRARGVTSISTVVVDDRYFDSRQLAPGFESFSAGSYYRPTSSALNVDDNAVVIKISTPSSRRRPRVDVLPPSDYVKVRKRLQFARRHKRRGSSRNSRNRRVSVTMRRSGSIMWLTVSGTVDRKAATMTTRRAVYDPAFNVGWAFRRALVESGVKINGSVMRGRWPKGLKVLARRAHGLLDVLRATNTHSNNLAAENLVRAMGKQTATQAQPDRRKKRRRAPDTWKLGLQRLDRELAAIGVTGFRQGNGSGLHRGSRASVRQLGTLLQRIYCDKSLRTALLPTLAVAGTSGTLTRRLRGTAAEGVIAAKTGTLAGALALSGYVDPTSERPLAFSIIVNGRSDSLAKDAIDSIAVLLARFARGLPLAEPHFEPQPPASAPSGS